MKRLAYALAVLLWLVVMCTPAVAFILATRGSLQIGGSPTRHLRLFLVEADAAAGVGLEWTRPAAGQPHCGRTSLVYLLWQGQGQNTTYCQCYEPGDGDVVSAEQCRSD